MEKPETTFCFRIWDKVAKKWCTSGLGHSKKGKLYSKTGHARSAITGQMRRNNPRKKEEYELKFYKLVEITEKEYNEIRANES